MFNNLNIKNISMIKIINGLEEKHQIRFSIILSVFASLFIVIFLLFISSITSKSIYVKNNNNNTKLNDNSILFAENSIFNFFTKDNKNIKIQSQTIEITKNEEQTLKNSTIKTKDFFNTEYEGKTDLIEINNNNKTFRIPNNLEFYDLNNTNDFLKLSNIYGAFSGEIHSKKFIEFKRKNLSIFAKNYQLSIDKKHLKINDKIEITFKTKKDLIKLQSKETDIFLNDNKISINGKIKIKFNNNFIYTRNILFSLDDNNKITNLIIFDNNDVKIKYEKAKIKAKFVYFDFKENMLVMYKDVSIKNDKNFSTTEFYIFDIPKKYSLTFNKNTILQKNEKEKVYKILKKLSQNVNEKEKEYIDYVIKYNKSLNAKNKEDDLKLNRTKRTKIILFS